MTSYSLNSLFNSMLFGAALWFAIAKLENSSERFDGCLKRSVRLNDSCYWFSTYKLRAESAQDECRRKGGSLAPVSDETLYDLLTRTNYYLFDVGYWIGVVKIPEAEKWVYIDNNKSDASTVRLWSVSEPALGNNNASCAAMWVAGGLRWVTLNCESLRFVICEIKTAVNATGEHGDAHCRDGYSFFDSRCYRIFRMHKSFTDASLFCQINERGKLATPTKQKHHVFLINLIHKDWIWVNASMPDSINQKDSHIPKKMSVFFVGLYNQFNNWWSYEDNSVVLISDYMWFEGEPNNLPGEDCAVLREQMNDMPCDRYFHFICKLPVVAAEIPLLISEAEKCPGTIPKNAADTLYTICSDYVLYVVIAAASAIFSIILLVIITILCLKLRKSSSHNSCFSQFALDHQRSPMPLPRKDENSLKSSKTTIMDAYIDVEPSGNQYQDTNQRPILRRLPSVPNTYVVKNEEIYDEINDFGVRETDSGSGGVGRTVSNASNAPMVQEGS